MLSWKIALRYLLAKKSHKAVNVISVISLVGVAVSTAAIIIVLSVFNGFSDLAHSRLTLLEPDIKVSPAVGKIIPDADAIATRLGKLPGVKGAIPTITERGLLVSRDAQLPIVIHAVPDSFSSVVDIDSAVIDGAFLTRYADLPAAALSVGVAVEMHTRPDPEKGFSIYVPRRSGRINPANPAASYVNLQFVPTSVVRSSQDKFDKEGVIIPLSAARHLLEYTHEASAIELSLLPGANTEALKAEINTLVPDANVESRIEQLADAFRMIKIEKWITFLLMSFILIIASFNIISTLSLLVIEKRDNMATLRAMGASASRCRNIFVIEGWLITTLGGVAGIIVGAALSLAQQMWGIITLSGEKSSLIISAYPCRLAPSDMLLTLLLVIIVGFIIAQSTRLFSK